MKTFRRRRINKKSFGYILLLLTGCSYHWTQGTPGHQILTIAVPFVEGDGDGALTHEIVRALVSSGKVNIRQKGAPYRLHASFLQSNSETIGYRRDRQKIGRDIKKNLLAAEARRTLSVAVTLYEGMGDKIVYGPIHLDTDSDYDYVDGDSIEDLAFINPLGQQQVVLPFSLGQLESKEAAQEAAAKPLYAKMAKKIVDAIFDDWYCNFHD